MKKITRMILFLSITPFVLGKLLSEEKEFRIISPTEVLMTLTVTATKTTRYLKDTPVETSLITKEDIESSNAKNVSELLKIIPGFSIFGENVPGSSAYTSRFRGFDFDKGYGLVLIDGERVLGGGMGEYGISVNQIPPEMIQQVEVVKGPFSALYGSDAVSGVLNIITKPISEKPLFSFGCGYGYPHMSKINLFYSRKIDKVGFLITTQRETSERGRYGASKDDFEGEYYLSKLTYDFKNNIKFSLGMNFDDLKWNYQIDKKYRFSPSLEFTFSDLSTLKLSGYFHRLYMDSFSPGYTRRTGDITYYQTETRYTRYFGKRHLFTSGIEYLQRDIDANFAKESDLWASFYLQDEMNVKPFDIVVGGRYDYCSIYGTEFNPKVSTMWNISDKTKLRASVGRAFKTPTIRQLYVFFKHGNWWNKPNPDLDPEISWGYQIGLEQMFSEKVLTSISLFRNDVEDIIVAVDTGEKIDGVPVRSWKNFQKAYTQGVETSLRANIFKSFSLNLGYTYLDTKNEILQKELPYSPHYIANIGFNYQIAKLGASFGWNTYYSSEQYTDEQNTKKINSYSISNLKITKDITSQLSFSVEIDNIFDSDYGQPDKDWLGRVIFGKLDVKF
jgi:outer membrane receptor for ferrienterochelin and colicins